MVGCLTAAAQPRYNLDKMNREKLNRGVVAIRNGEQVVVSWRCLSSDDKGEAFNIYRNGVKLRLNELKLLSGERFAVYGTPDGFLGTAIADREEQILRVERNLKEPQTT